MPRSSRPAETLPALIDRALPRRSLRVNRGPLVAAILERIETWKSLRPRVTARSQRAPQTVAIARSLNAAIEKAASKLRKLGVDAEITKARAERGALGIDPAKAPLAGHSAALDLYLIAWRASDGLQRWGRFHLKGSAHPKAFSAELVEHLEELCRKQAGLSSIEFADLLFQIGGTHGLPTLTPETLRKRRQRGTK